MIQGGLAGWKWHWQNHLMTTSRANQIKAKAHQYYVFGIACFSVIVTIVVTVMVIVHRNSS